MKMLQQILQPGLAARMYAVKAASSVLRGFFVSGSPVLWAADGRAARLAGAYPVRQSRPSVHPIGVDVGGSLNEPEQRSWR